MYYLNSDKETFFFFSFKLQLEKLRTTLFLTPYGLNAPIRGVTTALLLPAGMHTDLCARNLGIGLNMDCLLCAS